LILFFGGSREYGKKDETRYGDYRAMLNVYDSVTKEVFGDDFETKILIGPKSQSRDSADDIYFQKNTRKILFHRSGKHDNRSFGIKKVDEMSEYWDSHEDMSAGHYEI
jgi:hypothetical protein